jgi:hypothetical protein
MLRNCVAGFQYWPQLDDYIQHHNYAAGFTFPELQKVVGVLSARPLAGLADYFLWSPLFERMIFGVAIISALYAASVMLSRRLLERYFPVGPIFPVVMALLPLGIEGTYWMSASTRVVCGLFFACLTAVAFGHWLDSGQWYWGAAFALLLLVPFGFYEQSAVLAMTLVLGMALLEVRKCGKRAALALWVFPAMALYVSISRLLSAGGVYAGRDELMLPTSSYYWDTFLPDILGQFKTVFLQGNAYTLVKGFVRGGQMLLSQRNFVWMAAIFLAANLYGWLAVHRGKEERHGGILPLVSAVLLTVAPLTPFLILSNPWFSFRGAVTSFVGIALAVDTVVMTVWNILPGRGVGPAVLGAAAAIVFCVAGGSEIMDYRDTYWNDQQAATVVIEQLTQDFPTAESREGVRVGILGLEGTFLEDQNYLWHEHIQGCTESDWAFGGLLVSRVGTGQLPSVTPLHTDPIYRHWNAETTRPETFDVLYYYDGTSLERVELRGLSSGEHDFDVYDQTGVLGTIQEEAGEIGSFQFG